MDGYGYAAIKIGKALQQQADVALIDMCVNGRFSEVGEKTWHVEGPAVCMMVPDWWAQVKAERLVGLTMFESTKMPDWYVRCINETAEACIVPSQWCGEIFREQVSVPVHVAQWGIDTEDYYPLDRTRTEAQPYTFLWSGGPDMRKGWDVAYGAFIKAFGRSQDVRLRLHFREMPIGVLGFRDENVDVVVGYFDRPHLRQMLQAADCFVFPSRGEGWGLPPREAAATGLPVIATRWGGLADEIDKWAIPLDVQEMQWAMYGPWRHGDVGHWAEPDKEALADWMRWCFENRALAAKLGRRSADWLAQNTPWSRTAQQVASVVGV